jgi:hypothetical protein
MPPARSTRHIYTRGIGALRRVLKRLRWNNQGGYSCYLGGGKWDFVSTSLPQTSPSELNDLFMLAGIKPDKIVPKGTCKDCAHSKDGRDGGWDKPCVSCGRPKMTLFKRKRRS